MKHIKRKSLLYKTGVEYGDYTINHIQGCSHGCKYPCYAMAMAKRFGKARTYEEWCEPKLVENALDIIDQEIPKYRNKIKSVHLCFTSDPFMYGYKEVSEMSYLIIKKLNNAGIKCTVLTKGILPINLADLSLENEYGITLVSLNKNFINNFEPYAAPIEERIQALKNLHDKGCKTWVSIEPYPTPNFIEQDIKTILEAISFCDKIIFGRLNYNKKVSEYRNYKQFFNSCAQTVEEFCKENNKKCHIKEGTVTDMCEKDIR
ncbi:MAG: radical SAM protein [Oscillospiraceae bacterium]|nr:radical SAM protein [Oscillospiraceae bacterium]